MMKLFRKRVASYDRNIPESGPPMGPPPSVPGLLAPPVASLTDYRIDGPDEARRIALGHRMCETAPNGTGTRCLCGFDCANYWLRANGYKGRLRS